MSLAAPLPVFKMYTCYITGHKIFICIGLIDAFPLLVPKVCVWHMTMEEMQVSYKKSATGWEAYEACRMNGAFIVIAHSHVYARS